MSQLFRHSSSSRLVAAAAASATLSGSLLVSFGWKQETGCEKKKKKQTADEDDSVVRHDSRYGLIARARQPQPQRLLSSSSSNENKTKNASKNRPRLVFLGTGSSTGCPRPLCPMVFGTENQDDVNEEQENNNPNHNTTRDDAKLKNFLAQKCQVSNLAMQGNGDPRHNRNYRNNPCLLISHDQHPSGEMKNIVIDVGKTWRETALRWFPVRNIRSLDAILLTHEHADAIFGLDDVRGFQRWQLVPSSDTSSNDESGGVRPVAVPMEIHLSQHCLDDLRIRFPWLFPLPKASDDPPAVSKTTGKPIIQRHVASFDVHVFEPLQPFNVQGLSMVPLPVMHGEDLVSMGYAFTLGGTTNVVYLSDISRMLPETLDYIQHKLPQPTHILIVDALHPVQTNPTHFNLIDAVELVQQIQPKQVYLVGMNCDSYLPHDEMNKKLKKDHNGNNNIQLAHDGLEIEC